MPTEQDVHEIAAETALDLLRGEPVNYLVRNTIEIVVRQPTFLKTLATALLAHPETCDVMKNFTLDVVETSVNEFEAKFMAGVN